MDVNEGKRKAKAAVQATFDRYKLLASKRPQDHIVSNRTLSQMDFCN
jgi:hypothetical protein